MAVRANPKSIDEEKKFLALIKDGAPFSCYDLHLRLFSLKRFDNRKYMRTYYLIEKFSDNLTKKAMRGQHTEKVVYCWRT
jgi:hypothetical protein